VGFTVLGGGVHGRRIVGFVAAVAASLVALAGVAFAAPGGEPGPPPWAPGPAGPDVVHVMHGNGARPGGGGGTTSPLLSYHGGAVQTAPTVYLVFWGSQWTNNDPAGEATLLRSFLGGLWGSADTWSTSTTQYCQSVAVGSTNCDAASAGNKISHPASTPLLGYVYDNTVTAPTHPKQRDIANEAVRAAGLFNVQPGSRAQFVIATAHNNNATGFGSSYCAWHSSTSFGNSSLAYTNMPYIPDAGASCGANFVNKSTGTLDGVTIVEGHEYAETVTDPFPNSGWLDGNGAENGDKCAWVSSGQGAAANVHINGGTFPVQSLWSNNFSSVGGCVTSY
jgi:serine protease